MPWAIRYRRSIPGRSTKGPIEQPEALKPATISPAASRSGIAPAPGKAASGEQATKPIPIGGGSFHMRSWWTVLGTCWVAVIQAFERARAIPPASSPSIREAEISAPSEPTTAKAPRAPTWAALSIARSISLRASL